MWPAMARRMAKRYGPSLDARRGGDSLRWKVPLNAITFRTLRTDKPSRKRAIPAARLRKNGQFDDATRESGVRA